MSGWCSNVRGLETTATFDKASKSFILDTPTLTSMKVSHTALRLTCTQYGCMDCCCHTTLSQHYFITRCCHTALSKHCAIIHCSLMCLSILQYLVCCCHCICFDSLAHHLLPCLPRLLPLLYHTRWCHTALSQHCFITPSHTVTLNFYALLLSRCSQ